MQSRLENASGETADEQSTDSKPASLAESDIIKLALDRFQLAVDAESKIRQLGLEDARFVSGEQWPDDVRAAREADGRPCHTINRLPQFVRQITNDAKQNRQALKVSPVDSSGDPDTAEVLQGLMRHIEYSSDSDIAWDTAFENAVKRGYGFIRLLTRYKDHLSFDQEIAFSRVRNPDSCYIDPHYQQPDGSDAQWGFCFEDMSPDQFKAAFPDAKMSSMDDWASIGNSKPGWASSESVRVCDYYALEQEPVTVLKFSDGSVHIDGEIPKELVNRPEVTLLQSRETTRTVCRLRKMNAVEVLEETILKTQFIPIIPVLGEETIIDGERILESLVRHAKDSQRMLNYWKSTETETITLAPKSPWIIAEGQIEGYEEIWATANRRNHVYLPYKPTTVAGIQVSAPQRNVFEPPVQAITQAAMLTQDDMKSVMGIYDASMGAQSNETSGIAIQRRSSQSQTSNFHFLDNLAKSRRHAGRIILELIPSIYDIPQMLRIIGEDGAEKIVQVNKPHSSGGIEKVFDLTTGKYDVTIDSGPSYQTKRQEAVDAMLQFMKAMPQQAALAADLLVKNLDWPGASELADRVRPPQFNEKEKQVPPQVQQQMQQMGQTIEQLSKELQARTQQMEQKQAELESNERIKLADIQSKILIEEMKLGSMEAKIQLDHEVARIQAQLDRSHMAESQQAERQHALEQSMLANEQAHAQQQQMPQGPAPQAPEQMNQDPMLTGELPPGPPMEMP